MIDVGSHNNPVTLPFPGHLENLLSRPEERWRGNAVSSVNDTPVP